MTDDQSMSTDFEAQYRRFKQRIVTISAVAVCIAAVVVGMLTITLLTDLATRMGTVLVVIMAIVSLFFARKGRVELASTILIVGSHITVCLSVVYLQDIESLGFFCFIFFIACAAFLISYRAAMVLLGISIVTVFIAQISLVVDGSISGDRIVLLVSGLVGLVMTTLVIHIFSRQLQLNLDAHGRRLDHNERLFRMVPEAAKRLSAAAQEIYSMNKDQKQGMVHQSTAVSQTRNSLRSLLKSSDDIVKASQQSQENATTTLVNAEAVTERITQLIHHTEGIIAILETIRGLANKTDLLALNAALEGTKAGEAGRGFSLVASQMQRLAESTNAAVADIKRLTKDINQASTETRLSTDETTKLAKVSAEEAQRISLTVQQQMGSIEQVTGAMDDIAEISIRMSTGTEQTIDSTGELTSLATSLSQMVEEFKAAASS